MRVVNPVELREVVEVHPQSEHELVLHHIGLEVCSGFADLEELIETGPGFRVGCCLALVGHRQPPWKRPGDEASRTASLGSTSTMLFP